MRYLKNLIHITLVGSLLLVAGPSLGEGTDQDSISAVLHSMFDKPEAKLVVDPIVVSGSYAVAGWTQAETGGRALLRKKNQEWALILCAGDGIKSKDSLVQVGVPSDDATILAREMSTQESKLPQQRVDMFSRFEGVMMMNDDGNSHPAPKTAQ